jgi:hypothetical protein
MTCGGAREDCDPGGPVAGADSTKFATHVTSGNCATSRFTRTGKKRSNAVNDERFREAESSHR